jgi:hypothetical protein
MHSNVNDYCHQYLLNNKAEYDIIFQKEINVLKKIKDPQVLSQINPEVLNQDSKKKDYTYGIMGISDIVLEKKSDKTAILHELKCISCSDSAKVKTWIFQSGLYGYLLKKLNQKSQNDVKKIIITNLLSGTIWEFDMTKILIKYRDMMTFIMREKKFPEFLIEEFLQSTRA